MGIKLTEEQKEIIKALKDYDRIKVNAFAGTGKTTTIRACSEVLRNKKIMVLTFNRSIAQELKSKLPDNCTVSTIHGLAYSMLNERLNLKKYLVGREVFIDELINLLDVGILTARLYARTFEAYCNSEFTEISEENIVKLLKRNYRLKKQALTESGKSLLDYTEEDLKLIAGTLAEKLEYIFYAISRGALPITHDYYLKVFQLNFDEYKKEFSKYYLLALDEAQDVNGVQEFILREAPVPKKLVVGDKHQQIYSWRLAINTLARLKNWEEKYLTISFRFNNDEIVNYTNKFLKNWKDEEKPLKSQKTGRRTNLSAVISKTNAMLVKELEQIKDKFRFTRDLEDIFKVVKESKRLIDFFYSGNEKFLNGLPNYIKKSAIEFRERARGIEEYALLFESIGEDDYAYGIIIAEKYDIEMLYEKAKKLYDPNAPLILTTAHSAKGLEFDSILICEDFKPLEEKIPLKIKRMMKIRDEAHAQEIVKRIKNFDEELSEVIDEINLYYVAFTRALYEIRGPGAANIMQSFEKVFDGKLLWNKIKKLQKEEKQLEKTWQSQVKRDDDIDWDKLEDEFDF